MTSKSMANLEDLEVQYRMALNFPMRTIRPMWKPSVHGKSLDTFDYYTGGQRPLPPLDLQWNQEPKIGSLDNVRHKPGGGNDRIFHQDLKWDAGSKVGSLDNIDYDIRRTDNLPSSYSVLPGIGKIHFGALAEVNNVHVHYAAGKAVPLVSSKKYDYIKAKVGSLDNVNHSPRGGDLAVHDQKPLWRSKAKIGSLDNYSHVAGGGGVKITDEKLNWNSRSKIGSLDYVSHTPRRSSFKAHHQKLDWKKRSKIGSLDNARHVPGGGDVTITDERLRWNAKAKLGSLDAAREYDRRSPVDFKKPIPIPFFLM